MQLSLVIPCYNESDRIEIMLDGLLEMHAAWGKYECIVVDDGSKDNTWGLLESLSEKLPSGIEYRPLRLEQNRGKGGALAAGVKLASGNHVLTLDADMSARPISLIEWLRDLNTDVLPADQILIANRRHGDSKISALKHREWLGILFNKIISLWTRLDISDTQCGFKLYPSRYAHYLFGRLENYGWAHDIEVLYMANRLDMPIRSMSIEWKHVDNEKISVWSDGLKMLRDVPGIVKSVNARGLDKKEINE